MLDILTTAVILYSTFGLHGMGKATVTTRAAPLGPTIVCNIAVFSIVALWGALLILLRQAGKLAQGVYCQLDNVGLGLTLERESTGIYFVCLLCERSKLWEGTHGQLDIGGSRTDPGERIHWHIFCLSTM